MRGDCPTTTGIRNPETAVRRLHGPTGSPSSGQNQHSQKQRLLLPTKQNTPSQRRWSSCSDDRITVAQSLVHHDQRLPRVWHRAHLRPQMPRRQRQRFPEPTRVGVVAHLHRRAESQTQPRLRVGSAHVGRRRGVPARQEEAAVDLHRRGEARLLLCPEVDSLDERCLGGVPAPHPRRSIILAFGNSEPETVRELAMVISGPFRIYC
jgi:hypothetical protein